MNDKLKKHLKFAVKLSVSLALIAALFSKHDFSNVLIILGSLPVMGVLCLILLYLLSNLIASLKWRLLYSAPVFFLFKVIFISQFYSTVLPGQMFGEASKVFYLKHNSKARFATSTEFSVASVIVDKLTGLVGLLFIGLVGFYLCEVIEIRPYFYIFVGASLVLIIILFSLKWKFLYRLILRMLSFVAQKSVRLSKIAQAFQHVVNAWAGIIGRPGLLSLSFLASVFYQFIIVGMNYVAAMLIQQSIGYLDWFWICALISLLMLLPLSIGGIGIRENGYVGALALLSVPSDAALAISLIIFALQLLGAFLGGVFVLASNLHKVRS